MNIFLLKQKKATTLLIALSLSFFVGLNIAQAQTTWYVQSTATGANNGTSWAAAYTDLQAAINAAVAGDEIWVAAGIYKPSQKPTGVTDLDNRLQTFYLNKDLKIYGGFAGTESQLSERNYATNLTILSGNIGANNSNDNCYHVFITKGLTSVAVIDGFIVKDGNANGSGSVSYDGDTFNKNSGGGFFNSSSSPTLTNLAVLGNSSTGRGGGFCNESSAPILTNILIYGNTSFDGGGISNFSSPAILTNVTIFGNTATYGSGIYNFNSSLSNVRNSIIWNNNIFNNSSTPTFSYSIVQGGYAGTGNISSNPLFTDATNGDFTLRPASPAINAGSDSIWASTGLTTDLAGNLRPFGVVDMGAFERQTGTSVTPSQMSAIHIRNFPNPFSDKTVIEYELPQTAEVTITISNALGQTVATLVQTKQVAGTHQTVWNTNGQNAGLYFYTITIQEGEVLHKVTKQLLLAD